MTARRRWSMVVGPMGRWSCRWSWLRCACPVRPRRNRRRSSAMQDEMKRSMAELRMKGEAAPYYIAYELLDRTMSDISGRLGAIVETPPRRTRTLRVEVRVGDYTFDSSRFVVQGFGGGAGLSGETVLAPLDDDYDAMRREIWLTTDAAYKRAITMFARKKAAFQNRTASDPIPDFSEEPPVETILPVVRFQPRSPRPSRARAAVVGGVRGASRRRSLRSGDHADPRHALLPEQRRLQDGCAHSNNLAHDVRRSAGRRWHAGAADVQRGRPHARRSSIGRRSDRTRQADGGETSRPRARRRSARSSPARC